MTEPATQQPAAAPGNQAEQPLPATTSPASPPTQPSMVDSGAGEMEPPISPNTRARWPMRTGLLIVFGFFVVFGGWATFAPLESAAIAPGMVAVDSRRQTVQHLEGGIIKEILVQEGSTVEQGDVLIRLDRTRAEANVELLRGQYLSAIGIRARLIAERDGQKEIRFTGELADDVITPEKASIIEGQRNVFASRQQYYEGQREILSQRIKQLDKQIEAFEAQQKAGATQLGLIREEMASVKDLVNKGLERKTRLLALQRAAAEIVGNGGEYQGRIAQARQQIGEFQSQLNDLGNKRLSDVTEQLRQTEDQIYDLTQRLSAAEDVLARTDILAPRTGTVVNLRFHTPGGVVRPGDPVLDIVPSDDTLVIDARVSPLDIDVVSAGMPAQVRLSPYSQRSTPIFDATLESLSADIMADQQGGGYYLARVAVNQSELDKLHDVKLIPGMPAEVMLLTGKRTMLNYLLAPLQRTIERGMREN